MSLVQVLKQLWHPCSTCAKRRAKVNMWLRFLINPWQWRWVYGFCTVTDDWSWQSLRYAIILSCWCKMTYPNASVKTTLYNYFSIFHTIRNITTRSALDTVLVKLDQLRI